MGTAFRQTGFLQNFILPGLILIGLVVATIAYLAQPPESGRGHTHKGFNSAVIMADGAKLEAGLSRALADGLIADSAVGAVDLAASLLSTSIMPGGTLPVPPVGAQTAPASWLYVRGQLQVKDAQAAPQDLGSVAPDDVLYLRNVNADACAHLNYLLYGSSSLVAGGYSPGGGFVTGVGVTGPMAVASGGRRVASLEGCVPLDGSATNFVYYKVTGVR